MAHEYNLINNIKNNRGQALLEGFFVLLLTGPLILFLLKYFILQINVIALDEILESRLICELSTESDCQSRFDKKIQDLKIKNSKSKISHQDDLISITFDGEQLRPIRLERVLNAKKFKQTF